MDSEGNPQFCARRHSGLHASTVLAGTLRIYQHRKPRRKIPFMTVLTAPRPAIWKDVPDSDWNSWIWQQQKRVKTIEQLEKVINVTDEEREAFAKSNDMFHMGITPYYASLMDPNDPNCPVRLQSVQKMGEVTILPMEMADPLAEERDMPVPGLTHRYPDRVLFYTTHNCPVFCRHCTRKRKVVIPRPRLRSNSSRMDSITSRAIRKSETSSFRAAIRFPIRTSA